MNALRKQATADCELLLSRFQQTESVRFETFRKIWREMEFEQIFYGLVNHEKRRFTRLILDVAYTFLMPPFSFQIRVGGLYLLYTLYTCQTASPPEYIRLALKDWEEVMNFEKDSIEAHHFDVVYILRQLIHQKAFIFTAMPLLLMFDKKKKMERPELCEGFMERPSGPQTLINTNLEELSNVHNLYENLKSSVCPYSDSSVNLIHRNLVQNLQSLVLDFHRWQQDKGSSKEMDSRDEDSGEGSSTQQESSRRADLLASIKSRAYGEASEVNKSRRHRPVEMDLSKPAPSSGSAKYERFKQTTLKYRATERLRETGDSWKDVLSLTHISHLTTLDCHEMPKPPRSYKKFKWKSEQD